LNCVSFVKGTNLLGSILGGGRANSRSTLLWKANKWKSYKNVNTWERKGRLT